MTSLPYKEFQWNATGAAANGTSGVRLAQHIIKRITAMENIQRICDLGCGNGYITGRLASLGYDVVGVDASESGIRAASTNYPQANFVNAFIDESLPAGLGADSFDLVISSDAIEHFYSPGDLVSASVALVKENGRVLIGTPYHGYIKNLVLSLSGKMDAHFNVLDDGGHIKFFSEKTLSALLQRYGLTDLNFSFHGRAPWLWTNMLCSARRPGR
jgi:2-polyprenyl-3-methyl-5-hydroxy-6-metoxy-1,4-benzoquinol methylase